jgi:hypothetical protein
MTSEQGPDLREKASIHPTDLDEVKEAVCQVRALSPKSVLVDLVEEKLREIEAGSAASRLQASLMQQRPLFG